MPLDAILNRRLLIISGKGGVGKTTVSAALGVLAARRGVRTLLVEVEGKGALSRLFDGDALSQQPIELRPGLWAMNISPEESLREYFEIQFGMKRIARPLVSSQLVFYVTHAAPGLRDILVLGKVWHTATREKKFDLLILDTPAAGHTVSMLRSPEGFLQAVPIGPLASHTKQVLEWLKDPGEVSIHLVTLAEEMPVNETIETTALLEEKLEMDVSGVFVNMLFPSATEDPQLADQLEDLSGAEDLIRAAEAAGESLDRGRAESLFDCAAFYRDRRTLQQEHRSELSEAIQHTAPLVDIPFLFRDAFGEKGIELIADSVEAQVGE